MIRKSYSKGKNVVRYIIGKKLGLIIGIALNWDWFYDKKPGDKPMIWGENFKGKKVHCLALYVACFYVGVFKYLGGDAQ